MITGLLFDKADIPRTPPVKRMHVVDAGNSNFKEFPLWYRFECSHCGHTEEGCYSKQSITITEAKRGLPCSTCNKQLVHDANNTCFNLETAYHGEMITDDELKQILRDAIKNSGNNISQWARENGLEKQRGNISEIAYGDRNISATIGKVLGYEKIKNWVKKKE